jgi:Tat protein secretion system quality control protein TatD with DNase activity
MITGSDLEESKHAIEISKVYPGQCYATVGVHPCSAKLFDSQPGGPSELLSALRKLALEAKEAGHAVAFGEIGLDYDRLFLTPKEQQLKYFEAQLEIAIEVQLPLFLHSRAASEDFERLLKDKLEQLPKRGLVHSFTGTADEMQSLVDLGFDIGVNGCSMKSEYPGTNNNQDTDGVISRRKYRSCQAGTARTSTNRNRRTLGKLRRSKENTKKHGSLTLPSAKCAQVMPLRSTSRMHHPCRKR